MAALLGRLETLDDRHAAAASSHHAQASSHAASLRAAILEDRAPLLLRGCVPQRTVEAWKLAMLDARGPPLVPFAGETTVSNERNNTGPPTTARRLYAGATTGQLRTDAPDVAGLAVLGGLEDEGVAGFRERYGPNSFTLNHRFYLHLDNTNQLWLSAEDGCEGRLVDPGEKKKLFGIF